MTSKKARDRKKQKKKNRAKARVLSRREEIRTQARIKRETERLSYDHRERITPIRKVDKESNETTP